MRPLLTLLLLGILSAARAASVTIQVVAVPANTPPGDPIFIAGTFNGWNPGHPAYQLSKSGTIFTITLNGSGTVEFKFTRGSWAKVECKADGSFLPNRQFTFGSADTLLLTIAGWDDLLSSSSTALPNVVLLSDSFYMPQLNRYRSIWLYLPDDYATAPTKHYPVLYMQDGQNLFDQSLSFAGEWQVDETLHALQQNGDGGCIVVGIAHGGVHRIQEYSPWVNPAYGGGKGDAYLQFIVETLKPFVDANYRTLPGRDFTAIGGSSMGGLIAFYGALKYNDVFCKAAIFSPSFWFDDSLELYVAAHQKQWPARLRFVAGYMESSTMVPDIRTMYSLLAQAGFSHQELDTSFHADGQHAEWFWAREFGPTYQWLFATTGGTGAGNALPLRVYPQPAFAQIIISGPSSGKEILRMRIFDTLGALRYSGTYLPGTPLDVRHLPPGNYSIHLGWGRKRCILPLQIVR